MSFWSQSKPAQMKGDTHAIVFVGGDTRCKVQGRHYGRGRRWGGEEMKRVRGMMHEAASVKDLRGVISSSSGTSHLTDRLREMSGLSVEAEE